MTLRATARRVTIGCATGAVLSVGVVLPPGAGAAGPARVTVGTRSWVSKARELRDRYLEHVNGERADNRLPLAPSGKYDISRALASASTSEKTLPLLKAG